MVENVSITRLCRKFSGRAATNFCVAGNRGMVKYLGSRHLRPGWNVFLVAPFLVSALVRWKPQKNNDGTLETVVWLPHLQRRMDRNTFLLTLTNGTGKHFLRNGTFDAVFKHCK